MKTILPLILIMLSQVVMAQETTSCAFEQMNDAENIKHVNEMIEWAKAAKSETDEIFKIPVVVHNVYKTVNGSMVGDISKKQMSSQVDFLNEIYNAQYGSIASGPNHRIEFYLANVLPDGTAFDGILLHNIDDLPLSDADKHLYKDCGVRSSGCGLSDATLKAAIALPNQSYYNIVLVTEIDNNGAGSGVQGFAYFPTTSVVDGIVQLYNSWGVHGDGYYPDCTSFCTNLKSYTNRGHTGTHEFGHAFALFHTFQGESCVETNCEVQGDRVCDTPPTTLNTSCSSPACNGTQQVENVMGYTSQTCKDLLTEGQGERMRLAIANSRTNLINNFDNSHEWKPTTIDVDFDLPLYTCSTNQEYHLTITNTGGNTLENLKIAYGSTEATSDTLELAVCLLPNQYKTITLPPLNEATARVGIDVLEVNTLPYDFDRIVKRSEVGGVEIRIEMQPDVLGGQNGWELTRNGVVIASRESYPNFATDQTFIDVECIKGGCIEFRFFDTSGNGICCYNGEGELKVYVDGELYGEIPDTFTDEWVLTNCPEVEAYYLFTGERLNEEPTQGFYITRYTDGSTVKHLRK